MADRVRRSVQVDDEHPVDFITSGSTVLNLALSQRGLDGGWARGRIDNLVGDGSSGKTLCALEAAAHAFYFMEGNDSHNFPKVKKVTIVYNNVEGVMDFPIDTMYGKKFNAGVEWMRTGTIQAFGRDFLNRLKALKSGEFLLYIIDSWDALDSDEELEEFIKSVEEDKAMEGSFDLGKQRYGSKRFFKTLCSKMEGGNGRVHKDCTLLIVSQTRANIGVKFGAAKVRVGGDALNFYTHQVAWLREHEKIRKTREKISMVTGIGCEAKVKRNKAAKPFREARFPIMFDYGIDDISSMIHYLYGPKSKAIKDLFDLKFKKYESAIKYAYDNDKQAELVKLTEEKWKRVEDAAKFSQKSRFPI